MVKMVRALSSKRPLRRGEERALVLLHHLRKFRDDWESKNIAEASAAKTQAEIENLEQQLERLQSREALKKVTYSRAFIDSKSHMIAAGVAVSLGVGMATSSSQNSQSVAPLFYILGIGGGLAALTKTNQFIKKNNLRIEKPCAKRCKGSAATR